MFAVDSEGKLIWKSKQLFNESAYDFTTPLKLSVSIHRSKKLVVFASTSNRQLIALSLTDGSLIGGYNVTNIKDTVLIPSGWIQPPITFGNIVYYLMTFHDFSANILFSISLDNFVL